MKDRVASRSRLIEGDHALFAKDGVDHRALADIRTADDRHLENVAFVFAFLGSG